MTAWFRFAISSSSNLFHDNFLEKYRLHQGHLICWLRFAQDSLSSLWHLICIQAHSHLFHIAYGYFRSFLNSQYIVVIVSNFSVCFDLIPFSVCSSQIKLLHVCTPLVSGVLSLWHSCFPTSSHPSTLWHILWFLTQTTDFSHLNSSLLYNRGSMLQISSEFIPGMFWCNHPAALLPELF